ncbi:MAG: 3-methyl-2-oxobutanoate hydroxymethyltransferase, partial [Spirochaetes bacterium]|nr:3-methyl-2-oxobutanoate hydroxymethyltransferase [Spirochaetota bacterium]
MKNYINIFSDKKSKEKISMVTCYDYSTAALLNETDIDSLLVGDSLGMAFQGNDDT